MGKKILVAESDSTVQQVVSYFLNLEGFEVATAGDGVDALDKIEAFQPEAILLDPGLAGINGIEVSWLVKERPQFKNVPILYIVDSIESLEKMGKDIPPGYGIINKPVDPTKMVNTIKEFTEKAKQPVVARNITEGQEEPISIEDLLGWKVSENTVGGGQKSEEGGDKPADLSALHEELSELFLKQEIPEEAKAEEASKAVEADLRGRVTDDMIKDIVSKIARDIIERKVLEIVPEIAEEEVKKEIERLKSETPDKSGNYM